MRRMRLPLTTTQASQVRLAIPAHLLAPSLLQRWVKWIGNCLKIMLCHARRLRYSVLGLDLLLYIHVDYESKSTGTAIDQSWHYKSTCLDL